MSIPIATLEKSATSEVRVALTEYRGAHLVDIRTYVPLPPSNALMVTKKGVSLKVERLPDLVKALQEAEARAREMGLIGGGV